MLVKSVCKKPAVILPLICVSLVGCQSFPLSSPTQCVAVAPVLEEIQETDSGLLVSYDDMGKLTLYIEQLRQCVDP